MWIAYESPNRMGLINLNGRVIAPRLTGRGGQNRMPTVKDVGEPCEGKPHARFDGGREETNASRPRRNGARRLPPTRPLPQRGRKLPPGALDFAPWAQFKVPPCGPSRPSMSRDAQSWTDELGDLMIRDRYAELVDYFATRVEEVRRGVAPR